MAQQTAVQWLVEQLVDLDKQLDGRRKSDDSTVIKLNPTKIYEQAKEMEKEQIVAARMNGMTDDELSYVNAETYYNETYKKQL